MYYIYKIYQIQSFFLWILILAGKHCDFTTGFTKLQNITIQYQLHPLFSSIASQYFYTIFQTIHPMKYRYIYNFVFFSQIFVKYYQGKIFTYQQLQSCQGTICVIQLLGKTEVQVSKRSYYLRIIQKNSTKYRTNISMNENVQFVQNVNVMPH